MKNGLKNYYAGFMIDIKKLSVLLFLGGNGFRTFLLMIVESADIKLRFHIILRFTKIKNGESP